MPLERKYEDRFTRISDRLLSIAKESLKTRQEMNNIRFETGISEEAIRLAATAREAFSEIERKADTASSIISGSLRLYQTKRYKDTH